MLSEEMEHVGQEAYEYAPEVAKLERVAMAAKEVADYKRPDDVGLEFTGDDAYYMQALMRKTLADLPEGALVPMSGRGEDDE